MPQIPAIKLGLGKLTPGVWKRIARAVEKTERRERPVSRWRAHVMLTRAGIVISAASLATNRWTYTLRTAVVDRTTKAFTAADIDEPTWEALNTLEAANTASVSGIGVDLSALPGTFALKPIEVGTVLLCSLMGQDWAFCASNGIDGACA